MTCTGPLTAIGSASLVAIAEGAITICGGETGGVEEIY